MTLGTCKPMGKWWGFFFFFKVVHEVWEQTPSTWSLLLLLDLPWEATTQNPVFVAPSSWRKQEKNLAAHLQATVLESVLSPALMTSTTSTQQKILGQPSASTKTSTLTKMLLSWTHSKANHPASELLGSASKLRLLHSYQKCREDKGLKMGKFKKHKKKFIILNMTWFIIKFCLF